MTAEERQKAERLREQATAAMHGDPYNQFFTTLLKKLKLTEREVVESYVQYDMDVCAYANEIYESLAMRVVLYIKCLLAGSWHADRQEAIAKIVEASSFNTLVDVGFGVPTRYLTELVLARRRPIVTLADLYPSALRFAEELLQTLDPAWRDVVRLSKHDMDEGKSVGTFDAYVFQDSIEHAQDPTAYLQATVCAAQPQAKFIFSLPICPKIPAHYIEFLTIDAAVQWLGKCGLAVDDSTVVNINPSVDLFADKLDNDIFNLVVECSKA